jgi:alkylation response protein AidB-like acyl-CoA dehydrogenase
VDFGFGEDQELLRATTRRFLSEQQSLAHLRRSIETDDVFDREVWRRGAELGWTAMLIPPGHDGGSVTAQPLVDLVVLGEELGRTLNPGPFVPCNVVAGAVVRFGSEAQAEEYLPVLASGQATAAWCLSGDGFPERSAVEVRAEREDGGWRLDGKASYVHGGGNASVLLVAATARSGALSHFLVPRPSTGLSERNIKGLDVTRRFAEVRFEGVRLPPTALLPGGQDVVDHCLAVATVLQSAESVGAADVLFDATVEYTRNRVQFGRTIASFQAIKHRLADLLLQLESMRAATYYAALAYGDGLEDAAEAVATAGAYVDDTFAHVCGEALQLHGGIGFTWEHDVHLFTRRAKVSQVLYGDGAWHRERLVRLLEIAAGPGGEG